MLKGLRLKYDLTPCPVPALFLFDGETNRGIKQAWGPARDFGKEVNTHMYMNFALNHEKSAQNKHTQK